MMRNNNPVEYTPDQITERFCYMALYRSRQQAQVWPGKAFGFDTASWLDVLIARGHAQAVRGGYQMTAAGAAFWEKLRKEQGYAS